MKKLLCLLLSVLLAMSFAACDSEDDDRSSKKSRKGKDTSGEVSGSAGSYEDAIDLILELYTADLSKSEFEKMIPADLWDYYEKEEGMSVSDCYELVADGMDEQRAYMEEQYGENMKATYEIVSKEKASGSDIEEFLETMEEKFGLDPDDFGDAYEIELSITISGSEDEDTEEAEFGFIEYKGAWYAADALIEGF